MRLTFFAIGKYYESLPSCLSMQSAWNGLRPVERAVGQPTPASRQYRRRLCGQPLPALTDYNGNQFSLSANLHAKHSDPLSTLKKVTVPRVQ